MTNLVLYETARSALAEAARIDEVKDIRDKAEAMRAYGRMANDTQLEMDAADLRLRAERRLGIMLDQAKREGRLRTGPGRKVDIGTEKEPIERITLDNIGIDKKLSARAQRVGGIAERAFEAMVARTRQRIADGAGKVSLDLITADKKAQAKAAHAARVHQGCDVDDLQILIAEGRKFGGILIDPPWKFIARSDKGEGRSAGEHYTTTGLDAIKALPLAELAANDCVMFMWMVDWCPKWAFELTEHWGFEHKTTAFTWAKENKSGEGWHMGQGYWTRANPEDCWLSTRGHPQRINADVRQLIVHPVMEHSRKPDEIHERIMHLVEGPYLEIYARRPREGWVTWGNEISREQFATDAAGSPLVADSSTGEILDTQVIAQPVNERSAILNSGEASP